MDEHTVLERLGNLGVILLAVLLSTAVRYMFSKHLNRSARLDLKFPQIRLGYGVIVSLVAHSIEVALFALAYKLSIAPGLGTLKGSLEGSIADRLYFSQAAFTILGFGDIVPTGPLWLLAGIEALTGFMLIAWTASYLYLEMTQLWRIQAGAFSRRRSTQTAVPRRPASQHFPETSTAGVPTTRDLRIRVGTPPAPHPFQNAGQPPLPCTHRPCSGGIDLAPGHSFGDATKRFDQLGVQA